MLKTRIIAALIFAPALLGLIWAGGVITQITCAVLGWLMLWEYQNLVFEPEDRYLRWVGYLAGGLVMAVVLGYLPWLQNALLPLTVIALLLTVLGRPEPIEKTFTYAAFLALGIGYCAVLIVYLARLREAPDGKALALAALFCTWGADTGAYFAGRFFGRHKLAPRISPKKTIEGAIGGMASAVAVAFLVRWLFSVPLAAQHVVAIGLLAGSFGMVGDLCASMLKRSVGAKDSSNLIPGHGGVLDRFDGVMFAAPVIFAYVDIVLPWSGG